MKRTLSLKREHLADLTSTELAAVQGGAIETVLKYCAAIEPSSPVRCLTRGTTCINCE